MAPYGGPTLAQLIPLLRKGLKESVALGFGIPRATLARNDAGFELRRLSGGEGFGVQADLVRPFVDAGVMVETSTWQEMLAWLCENWPPDWGTALDKDEQLRITFSGVDPKPLAAALRRELDLPLSDAVNVATDGFVATDLEKSARACRAAREAGAKVDFEPRRRRFVYEVVLEHVGDAAHLVKALKTHVRLGADKAKHAIANLPAVVYRNTDQVQADYVRRLLTDGGTRLRLVEREEK